jgi:predicted TIM-barrel fold metal-dependent hydrolase
MPNRENWIIDCHNHIGTELMFYMTSEYPYSQDIPSLIEHRASHRLTHWVVFPFVTNLACGLDALSRGKVNPDGIPGIVPYAFENDRMLKEIYTYFPEHSDKLIPFVMVDPNREVEGQVRELRKLREKYPFYGLKIQATIIESPIRGLLEAGDAFVQLAREWNIPFIIHSSYFKEDIWSQSSDILDVAEANPDVRFCLAHTCRFHKPSLERLASLPNTWFDCSAHIIHCQSVVRGLQNIADEPERFPSDYSNPAQVLKDLYAAYPERFLWGSDSPFYSWISDRGTLPCTLKTTYEEEIDALYQLPTEARQQITNTNTLNWLGMSVEN